MQRVISWRSSSVLAQGLPEHLAVLPAAETPLPPPQTPAPVHGLHHRLSGVFLPAPEPEGQEGEAGSGVSQCGKAARISAG